MGDTVRGAGPNEFANPVKTTVIFEHSDLQLFKETALRQGESISELIRSWAKKYVEAHQHNDQTTLDLSVSDSAFKAFPTVWDSESFSANRLKHYSQSDIQEMKSKLEKGLSNLNSFVRAVEEEPAKKGPIKLSDINWLKKTRNWTKEEAIEYLVGLGYELLAEASSQ